jgi:hypothetical protein
MSDLLQHDEPFEEGTRAKETQGKAEADGDGCRCFLGFLLFGGFVFFLWR